ncbi:ABC transporter substrate-binding protein [Methylacidiphilum kamchatkense Kam1]|uniref:Chorismate dehydratase n=1 Tax=Methylacidiphilum kamchatkense Kam1 TaxID=1202785 RepID=A0A0C1V304_9BACT|nr:menaquinone biosynthesis protein [Methylacidiphilum kamchatkense]KIE58055.1 ABC transporter substrate-binding protein [Methylacidiphilum kamchatkense Kam1]QDQ41635.1 chorismate dehydratase [Methylacidiphilum kamchatkense Kam1]
MLCPTIGSVPYLNAKPLIYGLNDHVVFATPAELSLMLKEGKLDVALCPVGASLIEGWSYFVDGMGIVADGDVYSVILVNDKPLDALQTVRGDFESRSSMLLLRVIFECFFGRQLRIVSVHEKADGFLLIGDKALKYRKEHPERTVIDLGGLWKKLTGLPFVFALWTIRADYEEKQKIKELLTQAKERGLASIDKIAQSPQEITYLTHFIRYEVKGKEKMGIEEFSKKLIQLRLIKQVNPFHWV